MRRFVLLILISLLAACDRPEGIEFPTCDDTGASISFDSTPTWHADVSPLMQRACGGCHQEGGVGDLDLLNHPAAAQYADRIVARTHDRSMPPGSPSSCGECQTYRNARWLNPTELATLRAWAEAGAPVGDLRDGKKVEPMYDALDRVDHTVVLPEPYLPDGPSDDYRCFVLETDFDRDRFLTGFEVRPDVLEQVHHVILYRVSDEDEAGKARDLDADEAGLGYTCFGGSKVQGGAIAGWAPGVGASLYPAGTGIKIPAGQPLILQIHYYVQLEAQADQSAVDLRLEDDVEAPAAFIAMADATFALEPGQSSVSSYFELDAYPGVDRDGFIWGVLPHMHTLGKSLHVEAWGDDRYECLVDLPKWDFDFQGLYFYDEPVVTGTDWRVGITCEWDTRRRDDVVTWGDGTTDEMCLASFYATAKRP
jgi:hypothetical protein